MKKLIIGMSSFLILDLYFNVITHFISNTVIQFVGLLLFFPLASSVGKLNGLQGLKGIGLVFHHNWRKHFAASFVMGFGVWLLMYSVYGWIGKFEIIGIQTGGEAWWTLIQVMIGFFLGSFINDLITRGFVINILIGKLPPMFISIISIFVYALDDFWNGDLTILNFVFSLILGCSLTFSFYKSGSVWADTGIHFGLNVAYGLFYGLIGKAGGGLLLITEGSISPMLNTFILLSFASLLFLPVFFYYGQRKSSMLANEKAEEI
ncbi:hypothetical protein AC623_19400 [Bacillus sp. FJAT-27231]|uniref:CPBP family intramembrane glutamic endopeptidase n=1 Tax=Bacillus sp. FJAT-27231 TaxID=1679168 RepID=UPI0006717702|nr:CPBP family intramembrane glutamic endopeptidase [Bacillus sp. FJAT-27231]KMY55835.1 hypothetical protein AC623_19400 [Bacillus sp. FJAT-27231]